MADRLQGLPSSGTRLARSSRRNLHGLLVPAPGLELYGRLRCGQPSKMNDLVISLTLESVWGFPIGLLRASLSRESVRRRALVFGESAGSPLSDTYRDYAPCAPAIRRAGRRAIKPAFRGAGRSRSE